MTAPRWARSHGERGAGPGCVVRTGRVDAPLVLRTLPSSVPFGFLGRVLPTSVEAEVMVQLHRVPRTQAIELLHHASVVASAELATGSGALDGRPAQLQ